MGVWGGAAPPARMSNLLWDNCIATTTGCNVQVFGLHDRPAECAEPCAFWASCGKLSKQIDTQFHEIWKFTNLQTWEEPPPNGVRIKHNNIQQLFEDKSGSYFGKPTNLGLTRIIVPKNHQTMMQHVFLHIDLSLSLYIYICVCIYRWCVICTYISIYIPTVRCKRPNVTTQWHHLKTFH